MPTDVCGTGTVVCASGFCGEGATTEGVAMVSWGFVVIGAPCGGIVGPCCSDVVADAADEVATDDCGAGTGADDGGASPRSAASEPHDDSASVVRTVTTSTAGPERICMRAPSNS